MTMKRIVSVAAATFICLFISLLALAIVAQDRKNDHNREVAELDTTITTAATTTDVWEYIRDHSQTTLPDEGLREVTTVPPVAVTTAPVVPFVQ